MFSTTCSVRCDFLFAIASVNLQAPLLATGEHLPENTPYGTRTNFHVKTILWRLINDRSITTWIKGDDLFGYEPIPHHKYRTSNLVAYALCGNRAFGNRANCNFYRRGLVNKTNSKPLNHLIWLEKIWMTPTWIYRIGSRYKAGNPRDYKQPFGNTPRHGLLII